METTRRVAGHETRRQQTGVVIYSLRYYTLCAGDVVRRLEGRRLSFAKSKQSFMGRNSPITDQFPPRFLPDIYINGYPRLLQQGYIGYIAVAPGYGKGEGGWGWRHQRKSPWTPFDDMVRNSRKTGG